MSKISQYFNTFEVTRGLALAMLGSLFIYLAHFGFHSYLLNTITALLFFYFLLSSNTRTWFWSGFFLGMFWFWWVSLSFIMYQMSYAIPLVVVAIGIVYGLLFTLIAFFAHSTSLPYSLILKALGLLALSYIHPLGFDWLKPELLFVQTYLGIHKWQFAIVLAAIILAHTTKRPLFLALTLLAYSPNHFTEVAPPNTIKLVNTNITIAQKWHPTLKPRYTKMVLEKIQSAIKEEKALIIFPESVLPEYLNTRKELLETLKTKSETINIVIGALYYDGNIPHNSTYIFSKGTMQVAHKVVLVPFGEANPLPAFLSKWVNRIFFDGALDYVASSNITDYTMQGTTYRNAICFEATNEKLYASNPKHLIALSNNGWFMPSPEPTLQKLLLGYYVRKYGTTIYHSVNMSKSYMLKPLSGLHE